MNQKNKPDFIIKLKQATLSIYYVSPMILSVLGLSAILLTFISPEQIKTIFTGNPFTDTILGTFTGAVMMGNAMISYILGGQLLQMGVSLYAVTAFLLAWVTLGIVQIPMELSFFGKKFVIIRNTMAFFTTLIISILIVLTYEAIK
jgi:uncharacterized membrane protein YraQ (UPF0718 family)